MIDIQVKVSVTSAVDPALIAGTEIEYLDIA